MARFSPAPALRDVPRIDGARIAVVLENKFIPEEIAAYLAAFPLLGGEVELVARIWWGDYKPASAIFYSDVDPTDDQPWQSPDNVEVRRDVSTVKPGDYDAVIMAANYTSVRLRYPGELPDDPAGFDPHAHVQSAPLVRFFADAMVDPAIVKGALCHGLWILTPNPRLLRGRRGICHSVVMADILNCGVEIVLTPDRVVSDRDLVTGFSKHEVIPFIAAIARGIAANQTNRSAR
jgi:protease I